MLWEESHADVDSVGDVVTTVHPLLLLQKVVDALQPQQLQLEAKVHLFELLSTVYDKEHKSSPNPDSLARKPSMTKVKKVCST